jgi:hypothetical protein
MDPIGMQYVRLGYAIRVHILVAAPDVRKNPTLFVKMVCGASGPPRPASQSDEPRCPECFQTRIQQASCRDVALLRLPREGAPSWIDSGSGR